MASIEDRIAAVLRDYDSGTHQRCETAYEVADRIRQLFAEREAQFNRLSHDADARFDALQAENERLRGLLSPFADWFDHIQATGSRRLSDNEWPEVSGMPKMSALHAAKSVLAPGGKVEL